jgi:hypothetical protein
VIVRQHFYLRYGFDTLVHVELFIAVLAVVVAVWALLLRWGRTEEPEMRWQQKQRRELRQTFSQTGNGFSEGREAPLIFTSGLNALKFKAEHLPGFTGYFTCSSMRQPVTQMIRSGAVTSGRAPPGAWYPGIDHKNIQLGTLNRAAGIYHP